YGHRVSEDILYIYFTASTKITILSLHDALPISKKGVKKVGKVGSVGRIEDEVDISQENIKLMRELAEMKAIQNFVTLTPTVNVRSEEHTSELQSRENLVCRLLLEKKKVKFTLST